MSLWASIPFPHFPSNVLLERIRTSFMPYPIMQGVDKQGRPFLAQKVVYQGEHRVGFIIERNEQEWEYGLLEHMDLWVSGSFLTPLEQQVHQIQSEMEVVKKDLEQLHQVWSI